MFLSKPVYWVLFGMYSNHAFDQICSFNFVSEISDEIDIIIKAKIKATGPIEQCALVTVTIGDTAHLKL